jgi:hypothetical protein
MTNFANTAVAAVAALVLSSSFVAAAVGPAAAPATTAVAQVSTSVQAGA